VASEAHPAVGVVVPWVVLDAEQAHQRRNGVRAPLESLFRLREADLVVVPGIVVRRSDRPIRGHEFGYSLGREWVGRALIRTGVGREYQRCRGPPSEISARSLCIGSLADTLTWDAEQVPV